tara:strand:+ start:186 stop:395 length:210 start_codon:yes stop_codon:yes gene_type:complete
MKVGDLVQINTSMKEKRLSYYMTAHHSFEDIGIVTQVEEFMVVVYWIKKKKESPIAKPLLMRIKTLDKL